MTDLLSQIRRDIDKRLTELRPLLDETRRLEQARDALTPTNGARRRPPTRRGRLTAKRTRMTKAKSEEIDRRVLALLSADSTQKPITLAMLTETSVGSMNSRLNRLIKEGALKKRKRQNTVRYEVQQTGATEAG